jgi:tRNA(Ile)-lysidine synthase
MRARPACAASVRTTKLKSASASFSAASLRAVLDVHVPAGATGLVVALSGGADSAALLFAASAAGPVFRGLPLRAVHVDHGLQAAAAEFREACAALCLGLDIPLKVIPVAVHNPPGASLEAAARDARYAALAGDLKPGECLLTAHHSEDQAETLLLQALRGAGLKGLSAMPLRRPLGDGWHVRPLLDVPQRELLAFGGGAGVADPMNQDARFDRSYLRRDLWPLIEARWPGSAGALSRAARHLAEAQASLDRAAAAHVGRLRDGEALSVPGLRALAHVERIDTLRFWLCEAGVEPPSTARLTEALRQMLDADIDHLPCVRWGEYALRRYRERIFLTPAVSPRLDAILPWPVRPDARVDLGPSLGTLRWVAQIGGIDPGLVPATVFVRRRDGGEALRPAVKARTQSVRHLCQRHGVLPWMREALPLVFAHGTSIAGNPLHVHAGDALIAVGDLWSDARCCVAPPKPGLGIVWENAPVIV